MEHHYLTGDQSAGVWMANATREYCRWQWDAARGDLLVLRDGVQHRWRVPDMERLAGSGISLDLPETAKDVARLIERQRAGGNG